MAIKTLSVYKKLLIAPHGLDNIIAKMRDRI
jgi:hypothetical protein